MELLGLGHRRAGHAGELVVEAEVVLEGDRGQGHRLALDPQALLGLDRLVQSLAPATARHLAARELVDDDDLAVLDDVVAVALVERVGPECLLEVAGEPRIGVVQVLDTEELLDLVDALLGRRYGLVLEVDEVVAALFVLALGPWLQARDEPGELVVEVAGFLGLAADDERRPGLVDQDVVDLVDDREVALPLDPLGELRDHVVAEVVEAELVVRAVGDVGRVGLATGHRPEVDEALVVRRVAGLEHVRGVVGDHPHAQAEEVVDGTHPLRVAPGEVVVHRDEVDAAAGHRVQGSRERRHEGLAFARLHLRDPALVEDGAAHQLDVEVGHPERPAHRLAGHREHVGEDLVESGLDAGELGLAAVLGQLPATLEVGVVELVLARLVRGRDLLDLGAELGEAGPDLLIGEGLDLGAQRVGRVDERLNPLQLSIVRVHEAGQESQHGRCSLAEATRNRALGPARRQRASCQNPVP